MQGIVVTYNVQYLIMNCINWINTHKIVNYFHSDLCNLMIFMAIILYTGYVHLYLNIEKWWKEHAFFLTMTLTKSALGFIFCICICICGRYFSHAESKCGIWKVYNRIDELSLEEFDQANTLFSWQRCETDTEIYR